MSTGSDNGRDPAGDYPDDNRPDAGAARDDRELRLALAMRGGASMAVWIGGAVSEINRLRSVVPEAETTAEHVPAGARVGAARDTADRAEEPERATGTGIHGESTEPDRHEPTELESASAAGDASTAGDARPNRTTGARGTNTGDRGSEGATAGRARGPGGGVRSDEQRPTPHPWTMLARLAGYDSVVTDVLAGASAGGLNGTLLSATLVYGMPFDQMRELWVQLADIEAMARPMPLFGRPAPPSLLDGDGYFRSELRRAIVENTPETCSRGAGQVDLLLTATLLDPAVEWQHDDRGELLRLQRRGARLRFQHHGAPGDPLSDFGSGAAFDDTMAALAQAARTTSAYPFAFEPARVHSSPHAPPAGEPDLYGMFTETTDRADAPFRVVDGGVLDNIPVSAAVHAIARTPAQRPTHRWLLYLNPDPSVTGAPRPAGMAVSVASAAVHTRFTQESLRSELDSLWEHNDEVRQREAMRAELLAPVWSTPADQRPDELARHAQRVRTRSAVVRAQLDAQAAYRLLLDPRQVAEQHPLTPPPAEPLQGWSSAAVAGLRTRMSDELTRLATPDSLLDVEGLRTAVRECLGWAWDLEGWARAEVAECKDVLYRLWTFTEVLAGCADRYWTNAACWEPIVDPGEVEAWVNRVWHRRQRLQHQLPAPVRPLLGEALRTITEPTEFSTKLAELTRELESIVDSSGGDAVARDGDAVDAVAEAFGVLDDVVRHLKATVGPERPVDTAARVGYAALEQAADPSCALRDLVTATVGLDFGRKPGTTINFLRVASSESTPLPFDRLRRGESSLDVADKVRGSDLASFGAFLAANWRANDWMWGRMDATASLVRLLADPERWVEHNTDAAELAEQLRVVVSEPSVAELGEVDDARFQQWRTFLTELWQRYAVEVRSELAELFARPADGHDLTGTRRVLVERLQWLIAAQEIPYVEGLSENPPDGDSARSAAAGSSHANTTAGTSTGAAAPAPGPERAATTAVDGPKRVARRVKRYAVGRQRYGDLDAKHRLRVTTRLGLLAHGAARPDTAGPAGWARRFGLALAKPFVLVAALVLGAPTRAAVLGFLGVSAMLLTAPLPGTSSVHGGRDEGVLTGLFGAETSPFGALFGTGGVGHGAGLVVSALLTLVTTGFLAVRCGVQFARGWLRWLCAAGVGSALLAAHVLLLVAGCWLAPLGLAVVMTVLTWFGALACRPIARVGLSVLSGLVFVLVPLGWQALELGQTGAWIACAVVLTSCAHTLLVGLADVLPPRRRSRADVG